MNYQGLLQHLCKIGDWLPGYSDWIKPRQASLLEIPADLEVEQSGVCFVAGQDELDYLWYRLREPKVDGNSPDIALFGCCSSPSYPWKRVRIQACCRRCAPFCAGFMGRKSAFYILQPVYSKITNLQSGSFNAMECPRFRPVWKKLAPKPGATWQRSKGL